MPGLNCGHGVSMWFWTRTRLLPSALPSVGFLPNWGKGHGCQISDNLFFAMFGHTKSPPPSSLPRFWAHRESTKGLSPSVNKINSLMVDHAPPVWSLICGFWPRQGYTQYWSLLLLAVGGLEKSYENKPFSNIFLDLFSAIFNWHNLNVTLFATKK